MLQKIVFEEKNITLKNIKSTLYVCGIHKDDKANKSIDSLFDNKLSIAMKIDSFKGDFGKLVELYGNGGIKKLSLVGLGNKKDFNSGELHLIKKLKK